MKNALLWIFKLIVTVLTLAYILTIIPITPITQTLGKLEFVSVIWSVPIILLSSVVAALQLKVFTDNHHMHLSFPRILSINFSTEFYNLFLPGFIAGGAIRCHKLSQYNKKQAEAFAALVLNRLMNTLTLAFFGFICWQFDTTTITNDWYGRFFLALFIGLLGLYALLFSKRIAT
ncbi:MAG: lysylphosphatidylglycerol synthase domain-containing protein, partial [Nitrospirales bacterium]